ncbi:MAG: heavy metal-associated domain-containing protein [Deltaproteobacteria bacterium]
MNNFSKLQVATFLLSVMLFLGFYIYSPSNATASGKESPSDINEVVLKVEGMTCKVCPLTIKTALKKLNGVVDADVSFEDKEARVTYEEGEVTVERIISAIEDAGSYKAEIERR